MNLNAEIFQAFQNKLKTGNRRGVHLNAIPGNSRYKFDLARLSEIHQSLPEHFIIELLTQKSISFKFSIHDQLADQVGTEQTELFEEKISTEEAEIPNQKLSKEQLRALSLEKLAMGFENLIFQNEVIQSEKGTNSLGFGFPILIRKDQDGQITAAPILIWSVTAKPLNQLNTWEISRTEDDPIYVNQVLSNHLQSDSGISLNQISEEMLADGRIDKPELLDICQNLLDQLKITQNLDFILNNYEPISHLKTKAFYEDLLKEKGDSMIVKSGVFSLFEVQKQNIINDYELLKREFKNEETLKTGDFQSITSVETDPSQQAILESLKRQSKILIQGPPGTGKSQTLTGVLLNALENKQKTIVVCEKQTALEVLYKALEKLGLGKYCIMIKDSATDRKLAVNSVRNTIDAADFKKVIQAYSSTSLESQLAEIIQHKENINGIHEILNKDLLPDQNRTEIVGTLLSSEELSENIELNHFQFSFSPEEFADLEEILESGQPLYEKFRPFEADGFIHPTKLTQENFHSSLQNLDVAFQHYHDSWTEIQGLIVEFKNTYEQKSKANFGVQFNQFSSLINETEILTSTLNAASEEFHPEITNGFFYKLTALFSSSRKKKIKTQKRLEEISSEAKKISLGSYFPDLNLSDDFWSNRKEIIFYRPKIQEAQTEFYTKSEEHFKNLDYLNLYDPVISGKETEMISQKIQDLKKTILRDGWLKNPEFGNTFSSFEERIVPVLTQFKSIRNHAENPLLHHYNWFTFYGTLNNFQQEILEKLYPMTHWKSSVYSSYFPLLLQHFSDPQLNFNESNYAEIRKKIKQYGTSQKSFIQYFWNTSQQNGVKNFEQINKDISVANLYNKRSSTNHQRLTLRQIVQKDIDLFTTFFPIILTTPDTCSNLFPGKNFYFDNVVFDEASQLKLEDNLPAILKGKNVIIAGDEHQMPPSNYFSKVFEGAIEYEDDLELENEIITSKNVILNIESLLDFALENNFEKNHLDFHYRSKHPYLIDFSNHAFYNSRLKPLPSKSAHQPIEFFQVDGIFQDHINKEEAEKVLEILSEIQPLANGHFPSVGIATFNITQRNYIKRRIAHKSSLPENVVFREKIQGLEAAGLFIKNLENIQGDERDIIIVSTTYGRKPGGKFIQSFGPVNHTKGYKLLNVIITRAKEKIYICNSVPQDFFMSYKDALEQEGSNNRKAVFYAYLAYCKAVSEENETQRREILKVLDQFGNSDNVQNESQSIIFLDEIYVRLQQKFPDFKISKNYHFGGYEFDILLEKTAHSPIVVECVSKDKYAQELGYLEDLHKETVLQNSGFEYVRIWSHNAAQNLEAELEKIRKK